VGGEGEGRTGAREALQEHCDSLASSAPGLLRYWTPELLSASDSEFLSCSVPELLGSSAF